MAEYSLGNNIDTDKVFLVNRSELEGRIEAEYYKPSLRFLEYHIRNKTGKRLRNYIVKMGSGATPLVTEEAKYYSNKENGIPFLRVQNLQTDGQLNLDDVKFINKQTHETSLKRSQVYENDLLIKITGVGRMAVSSVAPNGFVGNTNQHMVVVKTNKPETSKYLASYLNLDITEKLATRRATGATRPALDYTALKSIPIIDNIDFAILQKAQIQKQQKEAEAQTLLDSIDSYLLGELGITLPEQDNSLEKRIFRVGYGALTGDRFDPKLYDRNTVALKKAIQDSEYPKVSLRSLITQSVAGDWGKDENDSVEGDYTKCLVVRATEFDNIYNLNLDNSRVKYRLIQNAKLARMDVRECDLLIEKSGGSIDQPVGRIAIITKSVLDADVIAFSNFIYKIRVDVIKVIPEYLFAYLRTLYNIKLTDAMQSQTNGIRNLIMGTYLNQSIVIPTKKDGSIDLMKQQEIANHIQSIRNQAKQLQADAQAILANAKQEVEKMILG